MTSACSQDSANFFVADVALDCPLEGVPAEIELSGGELLTYHDEGFH